MARLELVQGPYREEHEPGEEQDEVGDERDALHDVQRRLVAEQVEFESKF
jgi:hypothetical protein